MRETTVRIPVRGIRLIDAPTGELVDLGEIQGVAVLTLIRHRY